MATDEEVVITKNGRPAAVLVSLDDYESWKDTIAMHRDSGSINESQAGLAVLKTGKGRLYTKGKALYRRETSEPWWMSRVSYRLRAPPRSSRSQATPLFKKERSSTPR